MANELASVVRTEMDKRGWSFRQTAAKAGISTTALFKIIDGQTTRPSYDTLQKLAKAFKLESPDVFFGRSVLRCEQDGGGDSDPAA